jgi:hypothetical protein
MKGVMMGVRKAVDGTGSGCEVRFDVVESERVSGSRRTINNDSGSLPSIPEAFNGCSSDSSDDRERKASLRKTDPRSGECCNIPKTCFSPFEGIQKWDDYPEMPMFDDLPSNG